MIIRKRILYTMDFGEQESALIDSLSYKSGESVDTILNDIYRLGVAAMTKTPSTTNGLQSFALEPMKTDKNPCHSCDKFSCSNCEYEDIKENDLCDDDEEDEDEWDD